MRIPSFVPSTITWLGSSNPYSFAKSLGIIKVQECCPANQVFIISLLFVFSDEIFTHDIFKQV